MTAFENTLWISNLNLNLCVCIHAHTPVCARVIAWMCWSGANTGQRALNKIKEFFFPPRSSLNGTWTLLFVCRGGCPKAGDAQEFGAERGRATGGHGTHSGSLLLRSPPPLIPPLCVPIQPTICHEQQYSSTQQTNPLVLLNKSFNQVLSSEILFHLKRS